MPLALGQMSVDVEMDVLDGIELDVVEDVVAEIAVLVGVGVVMLEDVWMFVEELLNSIRTEHFLLQNTNKEAVYKHTLISYLPTSLLYRHQLHRQQRVSQ